MPANLSFAGMARSYTAFVGYFSVRPELVEGLWMNDWWFDRLTTNG